MCSAIRQRAGGRDTEPSHSDYQNRLPFQLGLSARAFNPFGFAARELEIKKPSSRIRTRVQGLSPYLPGPRSSPVGVSTSTLKWAGCCGIIGPVPPPLWIRPSGSLRLSKHWRKVNRPTIRSVCRSAPNADLPCGILSAML
jgi:hypothetical protein